MVRDRSSKVFEMQAIGRVSSSLVEPSMAPKQGGEGAPDARITLAPEVVAGLDGIRAGDQVLILTWMHLADRDVLRVHPRDDRSQPQRGVFSTRSADRPNPIGLHEVEVLAVEGDTLHVRPLEAVDGTPVVDIKPVLRG